ncbi:hypothetical protein GCM10029964_061430 [Kibdelosporangium lantanae]
MAKQVGQGCGEHVLVRAVGQGVGQGGECGRQVAKLFGGGALVKVAAQGADGRSRWPTWSAYVVVRGVQAGVEPLLGRGQVLPGCGDVRAAAGPSRRRPAR